MLPMGIASRWLRLGAHVDQLRIASRSARCRGAARGVAQDDLWAVDAGAAAWHGHAASASYGSRHGPLLGLDDGRKDVRQLSRERRARDVRRQRGDRRLDRRAADDGRGREAPVLDPRVARLQGTARVSRRACWSSTSSSSRSTDAAQVQRVEVRSLRSRLRPDSSSVPDEQPNVSGVPQRDHRIDARRAAGRDVARRRGDGEQHERDAGKNGRIVLPRRQTASSA